MDLGEYAATSGPGMATPDLESEPGIATPDLEFGEPEAATLEFMAGNLQTCLDAVPLDRRGDHGEQVRAKVLFFGALLQAGCGDTHFEAMACYRAMEATVTTSFCGVTGPALDEERLSVQRQLDTG